MEKDKPGSPQDFLRASQVFVAISVYLSVLVPSYLVENTRQFQSKLEYGFEGDASIAFISAYIRSSVNAYVEAMETSRAHLIRRGARKEVCIEAWNRSKRFRGMTHSSLSLQPPTPSAHSFSDHNNPTLMFPTGEHPGPFWDHEVINLTPKYKSTTASALSILGLEITVDTEGKCLAGGLGTRISEKLVKSSWKPSRSN